MGTMLKDRHPVLVDAFNRSLGRRPGWLKAMLGVADEIEQIVVENINEACYCVEGADVKPWERSMPSVQQPLAAKRHQHAADKHTGRASARELVLAFERDQLGRRGVAG